MSTVNGTTAPDPREQRGMAIAAVVKLRKNGTGWYVPSQTSEKEYKVDPVSGTCTCPDHEVRKVKCKHIWAVEFTVIRETKRDGSTTVTKSILRLLGQSRQRLSHATPTSALPTLLDDLTASNNSRRSPVSNLPAQGETFPSLFSAPLRSLSHNRSY